jgi:hypothetical protein
MVVILNVLEKSRIALKHRRGKEKRVSLNNYASLYAVRLHTFARAFTPACVHKKFMRGHERPHRESRLVDLLLLSIPKNARRGAVGKGVSPFARALLARGILKEGSCCRHLLEKIGVPERSRSTVPFASP